MHSSPSLLHTERAQDQLEPYPLAAHSAKNTNNSNDHNKLSPQHHTHKLMIQDLMAAIKTLQNSGHTIPLMMDSKAQIHKDPDLQRLSTK